MPKYELALTGGSESDRFPVPAEGLVIGRSPEADIVLTGRLVSRKHARLWLEGDILCVEDLGSRNGIVVNGERVRNAQLVAGDKLGVGETTFDVLAQLPIAASRSVIPYDTANTLCDEILKGESTRFPILYRATQLLGTVFDVDQLFNEILEVIFDALPVRRGYVLTLSVDSEDPVVRATRSCEGEGQGPPLSRTLVNHVVCQRDAILTLDARADVRFEAAKSILGHGIRAAMCAPLCGRQGIVGAIYVDSGRSDTVFSEEDLQLLTAVGRVVGVAVENAQLYRENVERERLAALGQAMAGIGHCVKNIVTALRGGEMFVDKAFRNTDVTYLEKGWPLIRRALERIDMLVMNMLSFARDSVPERTPVDANKLIEEVLSVVRARAERIGVTLELVPCERSTAWVDERDLYRVLLNLVTNALDACETTKGAVMVTSYCNERGCTIEVHDNGVGIPPNVLPTIFRPFVTTKGSGGIGLGLACCQRIVRAHGGEIRVFSEPGKGTKFTVFIPSETTVMT